MSWFADIALSFMGGAANEAFSSGGSFPDRDEKSTEAKTEDAMRGVMDDFRSHSYIGNIQDPVDHDASSSAGGAAHADGHISPEPNNSSGESTGTLIKDVLQDLMNGHPGDAAREIAESQIVHDAATATAEVVKDALQEIGDSLSKEQS